MQRMGLIMVAISALVHASRFIELNIAGRAYFFNVFNRKVMKNSSKAVRVVY